MVPPARTHANGSIKRGSKDNATDAVQLRTGIGVQLKDIKVFNRARQKGAVSCGLLHKSNLVTAYSFNQ